MIWTCDNNHPNLENYPGGCRQCSSELYEITRPQNVVSNSFLSDLDRCERYSFFRNELFLTGKKINPATTAGTIWHHMMHSWHTSEKKVEYVMEVLKSVDRYVEEKYPDFPSLVAGTNRDFTLLKQNFIKYVDKYGPEKSDPLRTIYTPDGKPMAEIPFEVFLDEKFSHTGQVDLVAEFQGATYIVDFKSTAILSSHYSNLYRTSSQMSAYIWGAQQTLGIPIRGAIIDIIGLYKNVDPIKHLQRILVTRSKEQLEDWREQAVRKCDKLVEMRGSGKWDQRTTSCLVYNSTCLYMDACLAWTAKRTFRSIVEGMYDVVNQKERAEHMHVVEGEQ